MSYLLIGHLTADLTPEGGRRLGGTVSYAARVATAFGFPVRLLTSAHPTDPLLTELGPYIAEQIIIPASATSTFENLYDAGGHRTQYVRGVAAPIGIDAVPREWLDTPYVHLAPLTGEVDPRLAHVFRESTVLLTLQGWLRRWDTTGRVMFKRWFDADVLADVDIVVFSEEDIAEAPDLEPAFAAVVPHLFVTRAEKGGTYYYKGQPQPYPTPQLSEVNSTGAGDVFAAAVLCGMARLDGDMEAVTRIAAHLGANAITRPWLEGAPTAGEVRAVLEPEQLRRA